MREKKIYALCTLLKGIREDLPYEICDYIARMVYPKLKLTAGVYISNDGTLIDRWWDLDLMEFESTFQPIHPASVVRYRDQHQYLRNWPDLYFNDSYESEVFKYAYYKHLWGFISDLSEEELFNDAGMPGSKLSRVAAFCHREVPLDLLDNREGLWAWLNSCCQMIVWKFEQMNQDVLQLEKELSGGFANFLDSLEPNRPNHAYSLPPRLFEPFLIEKSQKSYNEPY